MIKRFLMASILVGVSAGCGGPPPDEIDSISSPVTTATARRVVFQSCHRQFKNHGQCMKCVTQTLNELKWGGEITGEQEGEVVSWFAHHGCEAGGEGGRLTDSYNPG